MNLWMSRNDHSWLLIFYIKRHKNKTINSRDLIWGLKRLSTPYISRVWMIPSPRVLGLASLKNSHALRLDRQLNSRILGLTSL